MGGVLKEVSCMFSENDRDIIMMTIELVILKYLICHLHMEG